MRTASGPPALVVIGDEILSGRTQDKNIAQIATWLNVQGIRLGRSARGAGCRGRGSPRRSTRCARATTICSPPAASARRTTTSPSTRSPRRSASGVVVHPEARAILEGYYADKGGVTDARLRMARVPEGAELIRNRLSGAPGIRLGNIFILAGVPHISARHARRADRHARRRPAAALGDRRRLGRGKRGRRPAAPGRAGPRWRCRSAATRFSAGRGRRQFRRPLGTRATGEERSPASWKLHWPPPVTSRSRVGSDARHGAHPDRLGVGRRARPYLAPARPRRGC